MVISLRMTEEEKRLAESYAKIHGISVSEAIKRAFFEKVEDEFDIAEADLALREFEKDQKTYTLDEVKKMFDLWNTTLNFLTQLQNNLENSIISLGK